MIEILFIYQLARNPMQAIARRWWCPANGGVRVERQDNRRGSRADCSGVISPPNLTTNPLALYLLFNKSRSPDRTPRG